MSTTASTLIASCFALSAFAVAIVSGLVSGNDAAQVLWRAVGVMIVCYPVGLVAGMLCARVVQNHVMAATSDAVEVKSPEPEASEDAIVV